LNFRPIGDVVTVAPSLNELDPKIRPSTELSELTFHCFSVGIPASAGFVFTGLTLLVVGLEEPLLLLGAPLLVVLLISKNPPKRELPGEDDLPPEDVEFSVGGGSDFAVAVLLLSAR
jgi:hypothetical protein